MSGALRPRMGIAAGFLGLAAAPGGAASVPAEASKPDPGCGGLGYLVVWLLALGLCALINRFRDERKINTTRIALWAIAIVWIVEFVLMIVLIFAGNVSENRAGYLTGHVIGKGLIPFIVAWAVDNRSQKRKKEEENPARHF